MKKKEFEDDGRTVASMDFDKVPYGFSESKRKRMSREGDPISRHELAYKNNLDLTTKERFALIIGLYQVIIPIVFLFVALYFIGFLLLDIFWLK